MEAIDTWSERLVGSCEQGATRRKSDVHQGVGRVRNRLFRRVKKPEFWSHPAVTPKLIGAVPALSDGGHRYLWAL